MAAAVPAPQTEWVRLGSLNQRTDVNHRSHRNDKRTEEYIRMLENGENPPPIKVHRRTRVIIDGQHRFLAAKFLSIRCDGEKVWKDARIEVVWVGDDYPDPNEDPLMFEVATAEENRKNGEPLDETDVYNLLIRLIKEKGKEEAKRCAPRLNQSAAYVESLYRKVYPSPMPPTFESRTVNGPSGPAPLIVHGETTGSNTPTAPPLVVASGSIPRTTNLSDYRAARRPIIDLSRRLRQAMKDIPPGECPTEEETTEMEHLWHDLGLKLNK